jgi:hypothetical protein
MNDIASLFLEPRILQIAQIIIVLIISSMQIRVICVIRGQPPFLVF